MQWALLDRLRCPKCRGVLGLDAPRGRDDEIDTGMLHCAGCAVIYPIVRSIPRFVRTENYASSFGLQWTRFRKTQLDSCSGTTISRDRFLRQSGWTPSSLEGAWVLDAGCGAGRFVEVVLAFGAHVIALDYSAAVEACLENFRGHPRLHVVQADILALPFELRRFQYVFCFGVLQHTPVPRAAALACPDMVAPGGRLAVDIYPRGLGRVLHAKFWLRPITRRLPPDTLFAAVERAVPYLLPISKAIGRVPSVGRVLQRLVPVVNYDHVYPLDDRQLQEWAVLDTFDILAPAYDNPASLEALRAWLTAGGLEEVEVLDMGHLVGRGRRPGGSAPARSHNADAAQRSASAG